MNANNILEKTSLNETELSFFTQLNGFIYFCLIRKILFTINNLFANILVFSGTALYH